ncbi:GDSL esterase/lipase [Gossypium australe]|uniref:GDSL esterase/lipase n=1 Tax=Gossypium australe TaxID=47621 RepID=A0A5B6VR62_9ROSI|nr:GDSL esterase/lipase [Gossypium australe]
MAYKLLKSLEVVAISVLFVILQNWANAKPQVPCYFIFGDSLSDNGNNNNLNTLAKVNYSPYGIDFPKGPTGRFSNGKNMQDYIAKHLGFTRSMPPFAESEGENILNGVNYALMRNNTETKLLLNRCIYSIQIGTNDYINNYFKPEFYDTSRRFTQTQYATLLVHQLSNQLKTLYNNGARKFAVYGLSLIGCAPSAILEYGTNGSFCVDKLNNAAALFNERLMPLINQLNNGLPYAKFTYLSPSPDSTTFVTNGTCCTIGGGGGELCLKNSTPCRNRGRFLFWDGFHPTEAWNEKVAERAYSSESSLEANPFNIHKLAEL